MLPLFRRSSIVLCALALVLVLAACQFLGGGEEKPTVVIGAPASGTAYKAGQEIAVTSTATDPQGITRIELLVDSISVRTDPSPVAQGQAQFQVIQTWKATGAGTHTITVRAYNTRGTFGEAGIVVSVNEDTALGPTPIQIATPAAISTVPLIPTSPNATVAPTAAPTAVLPTSAPATAIPPTLTAIPTGCTPNSLYVADVTIPDGTVIIPGAQFTKAWRVLNNGTCTWDTSYAIMWVSGAQMAGQAVLPINPTSPNGTVDLAIPMTAPTPPGVYTSIWRLRDSYGNPFGTNLTVVITVGNPAPTPTRTLTPGPGLPVISSFTCNPCTITAGQTVTLSWGAVTNATSASIDQGIGGVGTPGTRTVNPTATTTYVLTAVGPGGTSQASVTVNVNPVANFAGFWYHNFGTMSLTQSGASITGTYFNAFNGQNGTIAGTVSGNTLNGTWSIGGSSGPVRLVINANQVNGNWDNNPNNKWCGARTGAEFPNNCSFDGVWNIGGSIACPTMTMTLRRVDLSVTGTWCGNRTISGGISYSGGQTVLTGTSTYPPDTNPIFFYLNSYAGLQWSGHYVYSGSNTAEWCGWRNGSSKPNPCFQ